jgi:hypothetical protein
VTVIWCDSPSHGTTTVVDSLRDLGQTGTATFTNAQAFLQTQSPAVTEFFLLEGQERPGQVLFPKADAGYNRPA